MPYAYPFALSLSKGSDPKTARRAPTNAEESRYSSRSSNATPRPARKLLRAFSIRFRKRGSFPRLATFFVSKSRE